MNNREIKISELVGVAIKRIWIIIIAAVIGFAAALWFTKNFVVPQYRVESKYLIDLGRLSEETIGDGSLNQLEAQRQIVTARYYIKSYVEILDTMNFSGFIADKLAENPDKYPLTRQYSPSALNSLSVFKFEEESETYSLTITAFASTDAISIARCIEDSSEEYISSIKPMAEDTLKIIENARENPSPINVNASANALLGAIFLAVLAYAVCFVVEIKDARIKGEKELATVLGVPVLGVIPVYSSDKNAKGKKY